MSKRRLCKCGCGKQVSTMRRADKMYVNDQHRARSKNARMYRNRKAREKAAADAEKAS